MLQCLRYLFGIIAFSNLADAVKVNYISPNRGSTSGGTQIHIYGTDFATNLNSIGSEPNQEVKFVSSLGEYDCLLHEAENDESQLVCYTSSMQVGHYYVRVKNDGRWLREEEYCGRSFIHNSCRLIIAVGNTPAVQGLDWTAGEPQQVISVRGRLYTDIISSSEAAATNGRTNAITRVWLTSGTCNLYDPEVQLPYGTSLIAENSNTGDFICFVDNSYVGNQNLSFIVDGSYGRSEAELQTLRISADNRIYMLQTFAAITDVSPKVGSIAGGTLITITGRYFDNLTGKGAKVTIGGKQCVIESVEDTFITCRTAKQASSRARYGGSRGFKVEVFPSVTDVAGEVDPSAANVRTFYTDDSYIENALLYGDYFVSRTQGFFVPPLDANYVFSVNPDDQMELYFSTIPGNSSATELVAGAYSHNAWARSASFSLTAGEEYYFETRQREFTASAFSRLAVHIDQTHYTPEDTASAVSEVQNIVITSTIIREVQKFSLPIWTEQSAVESQWTVNLYCLNETVGCSGLYFTFNLFGSSTDAILYGSSASEVATSLNSLVVLFGTTVTVTSASASQYVVTFGSTRGHYNLDATSSDDDRLIISSVATTIGQPQLNEISFLVNGYASSPIPTEATTEEVADSIMGLFGSNCPDEIGASLGNNYKYYDMEDRLRVSGALTTEQSFCGSYSTKNPNWILLKDADPYRLSIYRHICFAYLGEMHDRIWLRYTYTRNLDEGGTQEVFRQQIFYGVGLVDSDEWIHFCYDFNERLTNTHSDGRNFMIRRAHVYVKGNGAYLDNIFFGTTSTTLEERQALVRRIVPPAVPHIRLASVQVSKSSSEFQVTFIPLDCGNNFPLLGFAFVSEVNTVSVNAAEYFFGSNSTTIIVERISSASPPVTGTFDISFADASYRSITGLSASISREELKTAFESLAQVDLVSIVRGASCFGYSWRVTFDLPGGNYPDILVNGSNLISVPDDVKISASTAVQGGLYITEIGGDFFRIAHDVPQVQVYINGVPSSCVAEFDDDNQTSCDFEWMPSATPQVTDVFPTSGAAGTQILITGTLFNPTVSGNVITIGGVSCFVVDASTTTILCEVQDSPGGNQLLEVNVDGLGFAEIAENFTTFQVTGEVHDITPTSGSVYGCVYVSITGTAFHESSTVTIGGFECLISDITYTTITCITTAGVVGIASVDVLTAGVEFSSTVTFEYISDITTITYLSITTLSVAGGERLTIYGSGFGSEEGILSFGENLITNISLWSDTEIEVLTPSLPVGTYGMILNVVDVGCAANSHNVSYDFTVTSISPSSGSLMGGTTVTVTGSGFVEDTKVAFSHVECDVVDVNNAGTELTCLTREATTTYVVTNGGRHPTFGLGYAWNPSALELVAGDKVMFQWAAPPLVNVEIGLFTTEDASSMQYNGNGFEKPSATSGSETFSFNNVGTVHYASGCVGANCDVFMRGVLHIEEAQTLVKELSVTINDIEANYEPSDFSFTFDLDLTPTVSSISPRTGTTETVVTIIGNGFTRTPAVTIGGKICGVEYFNITTIMCKVLVSEGLTFGLYHDVEVNVDQHGFARIEIENILSRTFVLLPLVTSVSPNSGSISGGTKLTIQGSGFDETALVYLDGSMPCEIVDSGISYDSITCVTSEVSEERWSTVGVRMGALDVECFTVCEFEFSERTTPNIAFWNHTDIWQNLNLNFFGSGFGTIKSDVTVLLISDDIEKECDVEELYDDEIICNIDRFAVGVNDISVHISGKGFARFVDISSKIFSPDIIDHVDPMLGSVNGGTVVTISGNGFVDGDTSVLIGTDDCIISSTDLSSIVCTTQASAVGTKVLQVTSNGEAYPSVSFEFSLAVTATVTSASPNEASGGSSLKLFGSGFGDDSDSVTVTVGGIECDVTWINDTEIECTLGPREGGAAEIVVHIAGKGLATVSASFSYLLDATSAFPLAGSYGGGQIITIYGQGFSSNSVVKICQAVCTVETNTSTEITCLTPSNENTDTETTSCDIVVFNGDDSVTVPFPYFYNASLTANITDVSPSSGGTAGGTQITIAGSGFIPPLYVSIDGVECEILLSSETSITCETDAHQGSLRAKVQVNVGVNGIALQDNADFFYIDRWSSVFTWGGTSLPIDQDFVIIQKGQTVLLDTDTAVLTMLLIDGGEVIFDEKDVTLNAENILITNGGLLQIGTEENPHMSKANIVMYGHLRSQELPIFGAKTLAVRNGTLDLHGKHVTHPWTKLGSTAAAGSSQITLEKSVDWNVDDYIVIASTGLRHSQNQNEKRQITDVSPDGFTLTLDEPLEYEHLGVTENLGGVDVEFRAEVGLLTRNIVFRGSENTAWQITIPACPEGFNTGQFAVQTCFQGRHGEEIGSDQFGGSIMVHAKYPNSKDAMARIENVEITYAGQAFRLGRYPIHFHLMGDVSGMYVRRCAIHRTFNRAITIHGTHKLLVDSNVVYNVMGGAIFIEDGIETKNVIQYNLAIFVRQSTSLLNDDITPAAYWVTNPDNIIRHNHAAGGTHFGFWYRMHQNPDGPSFTTTVCQRHVELLEFRNNTVHSQGWFGLWIFEKYFPMQGGRCWSTTPSPAHYQSLTTWNCEKGAEWVDCGAIRFIDFVMVNNEVTGMDIKLVKGTAWGEALIENSTIVGHSSLSQPNFETRLGITLPFSAGLTIRNTKFVNFDRGGTAFGLTTIQGICTTLCGGFYFRTEGLSFESVTRKVRWRWDHEGVILDIDGSLTGLQPYSSVVTYSGIIDTSVCPISSGIEFSGGPAQSSICAPGITFHRFALNNPVPTSLEGNLLYFSNQFGNATSIYAKKRLTHPDGYMLLLQGKENYRMWFENGEQFTNITFNSRFYDFQENDYLFVSLDLNQIPDVITINNDFHITIATATMLTPTSDNLDWYFNIVKRRLSFIVSGKTSSRRRRAIEIVDPNFRHISVTPNIYRCFYQDCIGPIDPTQIPPARERPSNALLYSDPNNPCVEINNDVIIIKRSAPSIELCWVIFDVSSLVASNITVFGVLEFDRIDIHISTIYLMVQGGRIVAGFSESDFFDRKLTIELRGNHSTDGWVLPGVEVGAKSIGCFGGCDFHGIPHNLYWTHLSQTAAAGSEVIVVDDEVDWKVGDEIVITTTGYRSQETEKHIIHEIAADMKTITLKGSLQHRHLGETYIAGVWEYKIKAEVGLLSRNIKIIGQTYDDIVSQAFGARVIVGYTGNDNGELYGWGRFSNVEFWQTGQEGFTESYNPRFSLVWLNTGSPTVSRPSFIFGCAFHDGFSTAIGTFGADDITIRDNVVHHTIHDGIRITGTGHTLIHNLVTLTLFRGSYSDRYEPTNYKDWQASFELSEANQLTLIDNTAAGSERLGFHVDGEPCEAPEDDAWKGNVAHGCLHGVQIMVGDGVGTCSMIRNFEVYKAWDYALYVQSADSIVVRDTIIVDSTVGFLPIIFGPSSRSHVYQDKFAKMENILCVGRSASFDPALDFMDEANDDNLRNRQNSPSRKAPSNPTGGNTCIMLPLFASAPNGAPFKPFHGNLNYPALHGHLSITGLHAHRYMEHENGRRDLVFFTNPANGDGFHPTYLSSVLLTEVENASKIFIDRPLLNKINQADCVDMECDAKKKCLVKDLTGGFLEAPGAVIPQAEFEWDGDLRRGLGDYRIPSTLRTATDGTLLPTDAFADERGILRNDACTYVDAWQAYDCHGNNVLDYEMLVIESLDSDTETRRLSPVALLGNRYIDLNNGPQDHGWCSGYSCQMRLSTFFTLVATGQTYFIFFTSTSPLKLRLHLLNVDSSKTLRVAIWYSNPQRLDVVRSESELYIHPENSRYNSITQSWDLLTVDESNQDGFFPSINSGVHGANFFDRSAKLLYVTLLGNEPIDIKTAATVIVQFGFPAVDIDDFYEVNLIQNLVLLLNVPPQRVRLVNVVRETRRRRKRREVPATVAFTVEIGKEIGNTTESEESAAMSARELNVVSAMLVQSFQEGNLFTKLNVSEGVFAATTVIIDSSHISNETGLLMEIQVPKSLRISSTPTKSFANFSFASQPVVEVLDEEGDLVVRLGGEWIVQVQLVLQDGSSSDAQLLGDTTITLVEGRGQFTNLLITEAGEYRLHFEVVQPTKIPLTVGHDPFITIKEYVKPKPPSPVGPIGPVDVGRPGKPFPEIAPPHRCQWTKWFDRDSPTGMGDFETLAALLSERPESVCEDPVYVQGRLSKVDYLGDDAGQDISLDKDVGLICLNDGQACRNYEVRFCCIRKPNCINGEWTPYVSADTEDDRGDFEYLSTIRMVFPELVCANPFFIDARRISDGLHYSFVEKGRIRGRIVKKTSFECVNQPSPRKLPHEHDATCNDYEVRFCCPKRDEHPCAPHDWTPWLDIDDPDDGDNCDYESLALIKSTYPDLVKCDRPTAIDARLISSGERYDRSIRGITADTRNGFKCCSNFNDHCGDYEVRFCCPEEPRVVPCDGEWTRYYDRDNPGGYGDYETLQELRKLYENEICKKPSAVDARIVNTDSHHPVEGQATSLDTETGFTCENKDQADVCLDYEVRFCCPRVPPRECDNSDWTDFINIDDPIGGGNRGDIEDLFTASSENPNICRDPTAMDVRIASTGMDYTVANQNVMLSLLEGFSCLHSHQSNGELCCDYKVRYCCPQGPSPRCDNCVERNGKWTRFFNIDRPSPPHPDYDCDCEFLSTIKEHFSDDICDFPIAIDARVATTGKDYAVAGQDVDVSLVGGFRCFNTDQQTCLDYKVRFCCPKEEKELGSLSWCTAFGDPHYITLDGRSFDFQGRCTYIFLEAGPEAERWHLHPFQILVENENRRGITAVSYLKRVIITINQEIIELRKGPFSVVNGVMVSLPYSDTFFGYEISRTGANLHFKTTFGIEIVYDGNHLLEVGVPEIYKGRVEGLCGNFNGDPSDDFMEKGSDFVTTDVNEFGQSYAVDHNCISEPEEARQCVDDDEFAYADELCSVITQVQCLQACRGKIDFTFYMESCIFDACASESPEQAAMHATDALFTACVRSGFSCPVNPNECSPGEVPTHCVSDCPRTCFNHNYHTPDLCETLECNPGCECAPGRARSSTGDCIPVEECPCLDNEYLTPFLCDSRCVCADNVPQCEPYSCEFRCTTLEDIGFCEDIVV